MAYTPTAQMTQMPSYWDQLAQQNMQRGAQGGGAAMTPSQLQAAVTGDASAYYNNMLAQYNANRQYGLQENAQAFNQSIKTQEMAASDKIANRSFAGQVAGASLYGLMNYDKIAGGISKGYNAITGTGAESEMFPAGATDMTATAYDPALEFEAQNAVQGFTEYGAGSGATAYGASNVMADGMMSGAVDAGWSTTGTMAAGSEIGAMSAIPGIGVAMAGTAALGMGVVEGLKGFDRMVWGAPDTIQDHPTEEIIKNYNSGNFGSGGVAPIWNELQRRGATQGLKPPSQQQMEGSYVNWADQESVERYQQKYTTQIAQHFDSPLFDIGV
jgi:hypothetical protein